MVTGPLGVALPLLLALGAGPREGPRPVVAVWPLQVQGIELDPRMQKTLDSIAATELGLGGVFQVIPRADVQAVIQKQSEESHKRAYEEAYRIELGRRLAASKLLTPQLIQIGPECRLVGTLYDLGKQATEYVARVKGGCEDGALVRSLELLAERLRAFGRGTPLPDAEPDPPPPAGPAEPEAAAFSDGSQQIVLRFESKPAGARVTVDGQLACAETPCQRSVAVGSRLIAMRKDRYEGRRERVFAVSGTSLIWELTPDFGWLDVRSDPPGQEVRLDGKAAGSTPIERLEVASGTHRLSVSGPCHGEVRRVFTVDRGKPREIAVRLPTRRGLVRVLLEDDRGRAQHAPVLLGGKRIGRTQQPLRVPICADRLVISHPTQGEIEVAVSPREGALTRVEASWPGSLAEPRLVPVPAGEFWMGCPGEEPAHCDAWERPGQNRALGAFAIHRTEITVGQYERCVKQGACSPAHTADGTCEVGDGKGPEGGVRPAPTQHPGVPVVCVDWGQARDFCRFVGKRLPTEAEWEKAARGGDGRRFPWGNEDPTCGRANLGKLAGCPASRLRPPCSFPKGESPFGLCDASGNASEWVEDTFVEPGVATLMDGCKVVRGGSYQTGALGGRTFVRGWRPADHRSASLGFRCAADKPG